MTPDDPRHGTYAGSTAHYKSGVPHCDPCREEHRRYNRRSKKMTRNGYRKWVDAELVARHIDALRATGATVPTIAEQSGVSLNAVTYISTRRRKRTTLATANALLQVTPDNVRPDKVPAWRIERRLQALHALGWTAAEMARRAGWTGANTVALMDPRWRHREYVSSATFELFDGVFRDLCMTIPPHSPGATLAKRKSAERGWAPPLAYDDIDDANATPDRGTVSTRGDIIKDRARGRIEDIEHMAEVGVSSPEAARRLGLSDEGLEKWLASHNRSDLYQRMRPRDHNSPTNARHYEAA